MYLMCPRNWYYPPSLGGSLHPHGLGPSPLGVRGAIMHAENVSSTVYDCAIYNQTRAS